MNNANGHGIMDRSLWHFEPFSFSILRLVVRVAGDKTQLMPLIVPPHKMIESKPSIWGYGILGCQGRLNPSRKRIHYPRLILTMCLWHTNPVRGPTTWRGRLHQCCCTSYEWLRRSRMRWAHGSLRFLINHPGSFASSYIRSDPALDLGVFSILNLGYMKPIAIRTD